MESPVSMVVPVEGMTTANHSITDYLHWLETKANADALGFSPAAATGAAKLFLGAVPNADNPPALAEFIGNLKSYVPAVTSRTGSPIAATTAQGYITRLRKAYKVFTAPRGARKAKATMLPTSNATAAAPTAQAAPKSSRKVPRKARAASKKAPRKALAKTKAPVVESIAMSSPFGVASTAPRSTRGARLVTHSEGPRSSRAGRKTIYPTVLKGDAGPFGKVDMGALKEARRTIDRVLRTATLEG
jgi:hypothetical protein